MAKDLGQQLAELDNGDSIAVTIIDDRYDGEVRDTSRTMCRIDDGFVEDGGVVIELELSPETSKLHDSPTDYVIITATELGPRAWKVPKAYSYDPDEDERTSELGEVTDIVGGPRE